MAQTFSCTASKSALFSHKIFNSRRARSHFTIINRQQQSHQANWISLSSEISKHSLKSIPTGPPSSVTEPMHKLISIAPPSIAPALCLAACQLVGGQKHDAMNTASAIQLMHAASYTHSQLISNSSCSTTFLGQIKPGIALMTGDGVLPLGYELVASEDCQHPKRIVRVVLEITKTMGPQGVLEGQLLEAERDGEAEWWWERKSGQLAACAAACGAILGGGSDENVDKLRRFGLYIGMVDEILSNSENDGRYDNVIQVFRSLARLELQGFDQEKVSDVMRLFLGFASYNCHETRGVSHSPV